MHYLPKITRPQQIAQAFRAGDLKVILHTWSGETEPRLRNLSAVDDSGVERWRAELPDDTRRDCFVKLEQVGLQLFATTFLGVRLRVCPSTGLHLM